MFVIGGFYSIGPLSLELPNTRDNRMCLRMNQLRETCSFDLNKVMGDENGVLGEGVTFSCEWRLMELPRCSPSFLAITCKRENTTKLGSSI